MMKTAIEIEGMIVRMEFQFCSHYEAMEWHDKIVDGLRRGHARIDLTSDPKSAEEIAKS